MKYDSTSITKFAEENKLTPDDVLLLTLKFASIEMVLNLVERSGKKFEDIVIDDIFDDYIKEFVVKTEKD